MAEVDKFTIIGDVFKHGNRTDMEESLEDGSEGGYSWDADELSDSNVRVSAWDNEGNTRYFLVNFQEIT